MKKISRAGALLAVLLIVSFVTSARAETLVALLSDKSLNYFDSAAPGAWSRTIPLTGIPAAESVQAFDYLTDGVLALMTREGLQLRIYTVNKNTGAATWTGTTFTMTSTNSVAFDAFGSQVRPSNIVLLTEADSMARFGFNSGSGPVTVAYDSVTNDGDAADPWAGFNPNIVALGSTNASPGATAAVLYGIDGNQNTLVKITWDTGSIDTVALLRTEGGFGVDVNIRCGFDISGVTGTAYLATGGGATTTLYRVDLDNGFATSVGNIGPANVPAGVVVTDIAVLPPTSLANIATRSRVGTNEESMIAGFITVGGQPSRLLVRAIGPSLGPLGVNNFLPDPVLTVFDSNGVQIATNDNWKSSQQSEIFNTGLAPGNDLEAAVVGVAPAGAYTAIVTDKNGAIGVGLVEIYKLPDL
ncbi:MAG TPA: DUF4394 domain-containing protein [Chthoniobacterales bacterium]|nr:DUF4394 domain-containing protein [Chthoniobacterales bacterium]